MNTYTATATVTDPRLDDEITVREARGLDRDTARRMASAWSALGYWASVYNAEGECIAEFQPR